MFVLLSEDCAVWMGLVLNADVITSLWIGQKSLLYLEENSQSWPWLEKGEEVSAKQGISNIGEGTCEIELFRVRNLNLHYEEISIDREEAWKERKISY